MSLPRLGHAVIINNTAGEMPFQKAAVVELKDSCKTVGFDVKLYEDPSGQVCNTGREIKGNGFPFQ